MTKMLRFTLAFAVGLATVATTHAAFADAWSDANCSGGSQALSTWKRSDAIAYAQPPIHEGYSLNGGCYVLNDKDDTPLLAADGGGEGTDCSGFVFRVWGLKADGTAGYRRWDYGKDVHGPFYTWHYYSPVTDNPFRQISKSLTATTPMDAFVWYRGGDDKHIAILWQEGTSSDLVIHAHTNTVGVEISEEIYRQYSDVKAITRKAWTLECYPKCPSSG
jgi:hypothetical protein